MSTVSVYPARNQFPSQDTLINQGTNIFMDFHQLKVFIRYRQKNFPVPLKILTGQPTISAYQDTGK